MRLSDLIRFFLLVSPPRIAIAFALLVAGGIAGDLLWSIDHIAILPCILFLQMFACSTGYLTHGARGHYDPVLTSGALRWRIGLAHLLSSAVPGVAAWFVYGAWLLVRGGPERGVAFQPAPLVFLLMMSIIAWSLTLRFAPLSGAALWTMIMVATAVSAEFVRIVAVGLRDREAITRQSWRAVVSGVLMPILTYAAPWPAMFLAAFTAIALIALALGLLFIARRDLPLAEEE